MSLQIQRVDRNPYEQDRTAIIKEKFFYTKKHKAAVEVSKARSKREKRELEENIFLLQLSKIIDPRSFCFCTRKQLLALNDATIPELIRFKGYLDFWLFI